jgi:hypothetical protein
MATRLVKPMTVVVRHEEFVTSIFGFCQVTAVWYMSPLRRVAKHTLQIKTR